MQAFVLTSFARGLCVIALLAGCTKNGDKNAVPKTLTPPTPGAFQAGPPVSEPATLLKWLQTKARTKAGKRRLFRLTVTVHFQDSYQLGMGDAHIGLTADAPAGAIKLDLDDGGLGISLLDTMRSRCPNKDVCSLWLEGYWGPLLEPPPGLDKGDDGHPFAVMRVHKFIADHKAEAAQALIQPDYP